MKRSLLLLVIFSLMSAAGLPATAGTAKPDALMLRFPDVSAESIVFVYAGDLWLSPKGGGLAHRLSSPKGKEFFPKFSPDGQTIAFSANYDGNIDVYLMPSAGGSPERLTHHPGFDRVVEWYPDGKHVLYGSRMNSPPTSRCNRFHKLSVKGGLPEPLPFPYGELGSFNPQGDQLVFQFVSRQFSNWKRYRGGLASDLWLYDFKKNTSQKMTDFEGTDALPMWHAETIFFLSDRDKRKKMNIWAYGLKSKKFRQITHFTEYDVKWPSIGPDAIIFENGGLLHLLDLKTEKSRPLTIRIPTDLPAIRTQLKDVSKDNKYFSISPSGKRVVFGARGEVLTVPEKHGSIRNLTKTSGIAERNPVWSPDGKLIAYFSDRTGEYELYTCPSDGKGKERRITSDGKCFRFDPLWSPDSKKIAFSDKTGSIYVVDLAKGKPELVDRDEWYRTGSYNWSADSRWLAYTKHTPNVQMGVMIFDTQKQKKYQVTSPYFDCYDPAFDPEGKYLFFISKRTFKPAYSSLQATWIYSNSSNLCAVTLRKDVPSPLAPRSDEEKEEEKKKSDAPAKKEKDTPPKKAADKKNGQDDEAAKVAPVTIDFENIEKRVVVLPVPAGNIYGLRVVKGKVLYVRFPDASYDDEDKPANTLVYYELDERKETNIISGINYYDLSADGKKIVYKSKSTYGIIDVAKGKKVGDGVIGTDKMKAWIDPPTEWQQLFNDAWRIERDFFYDPGMHGLDWKAIKKRYGKLLPYVVDRGDLNYVIGEMIAELNSSHAMVFGGDIEYAERISVGLLGCDFDLDSKNNIYRFKKIYEGAVWDAEVRSPLREPGVQVAEGEYLLAIDGEPLDTTKDPWASFQGLAGEVVTLTVNSVPTMKDSREVIVKPLPNDYKLRYLYWIEKNRQKVEQATNGRVGYIFVPDTGRRGQSELVRQFMPQWNKQGLIIDERFNEGGQAPDRFIELLNRPILNYWARRDSPDSQTPYVAHAGPKVMVINSFAGSGGDAFPYYFRKAGLGPLVGTRTWGGLIGIRDNPDLIDGGFISAPCSSFWNTEGNWDVEGHGVEPDYEIENAPHLLAQGKDPQLEKAIDVILELLQKQPPVKPKRPKYPDRSH
ncbi:PDZ domain-containing protein [candidate division CSSED10-310 bacterium]|uniref:Tricorn protease homolog n=1 Tax=candidate division CSSED10-310 bacterium TaxID=2855610 RepID=A0ABV6YS61_UNCC1